MPNAEPDYSTWSWDQLHARIDEIVDLVDATDAQGLPVASLLDEGELILKFMDRLVEQRYSPNSAKYKEWWEIRQVKDEPPHLPPRFGPRWSQ